jgi:adenylate kinase
MNILILGPQASGKGTQARLLSENLNLFYLESGRILREIAKVDPYVNETINVKGELLPDDETTRIVSSYLDKNAPSGDNIILDGFPRSLAQYELFASYLSTKGKKIDKAIFLDISDDETVKRLTARRSCVKCGEVYNLLTNPPKSDGICDKCGGSLVQRPDDKPEVIQERLKVYRTTTEPLVKKLEEEGILIKVDGEQPIETILGQILEKLK